MNLSIVELHLSQPRMLHRAPRSYRIRVVKWQMFYLQSFFYFMLWLWSKMFEANLRNPMSQRTASLSAIMCSVIVALWSGSSCARHSSKNDLKSSGVNRFRLCSWIRLTALAAEASTINHFSRHSPALLISCSLPLLAWAKFLCTFKNLVQVYYYTLLEWEQRKTGHAVLKC